MYAEKFELLEAKIRETAMLVSRLREEKRQLEWENEQLRARVTELEAHLEGSPQASDRYEPDLDHLLEQLDTLQQGVEPARGRPGSHGASGALRTRSDPGGRPCATRQALRTARTVRAGHPGLPTCTRS